MPIGSGKAQTLKSLLADLIDSRGWSEKMEEQNLPLVWDKVMGEKIASVTKVISFKNGELIIKTESSTWRSELKIRSSNIIEKMNRAMGKEVIKTIKFR